MFSISVYFSFSVLKNEPVRLVKRMKRHFGEIEKLLKEDYKELQKPQQLIEAYWDEADAITETFIYRLCRADFSGYLCEDILTKVDRASMLTSLEVRAPWLESSKSPSAHVGALD